MPCPHNEIAIVQRSQRQSAVAAAAYQSGEKLFCEYDQQVKHYPEKRGIVHNEILLPANAPPEYADRNTLWNAAEALQKQDQVEYLLDVLLFGETEEKAALITDYGKDVIQLEQRMAELAAADAARTKKHHERHAATPEH